MTAPARNATLRRMKTPPKTSVIIKPQPFLSPSNRRSAGRLQYGARMNSPRPWSYHQNANTVATSSARSALAIRLRSSVRCAISDIVACASRGGRRRRRRRVASVTVVRPERGGSAGAVGRAGLLGAGAELGGARLGDACLVLQLRGQVTAGRGRGGGDDLAADGRRGRRVLGAHVVVLHALHLALEDAQRAAERARGVRQLLVAEQQQDRQDDQADLQRAE